VKKVVTKHRSQRRLVESSQVTLLDIDRQDDLKKLASVSPDLARRTGS
jgi:CTP:molybdopterin cytidylyltransferase MocA